MGSPEFGFDSNLLGSSSLAAADELFFKGKLLPLQPYHRLHLLQTLSSPLRPSESEKDLIIAMSGYAETAGEMCVDDESVCIEDDDVIELNSAKLRDEEFLRSIKDDVSLKASGSFSPDSSSGAVCKGLAQGEEYGGLLLNEGSSLCSCNSSLHKGTLNDAFIDVGSSSFHSQQSGFWDSSADKDTMDSSSSSRDSNGSSQDYCLQNNRDGVPHVQDHIPYASTNGTSFRISWKLGLWRRGRGDCRNLPASQSDPFARVGFSEDLRKYRAYPAPSLQDMKDALLLSKESNEDYVIHQKRRCQLACRNASSRSVGASTGNGWAKDYKESKRLSARERWLTYARRLKPLMGIKRSFLWQLRMDECGRRADRGVHDGTIHTTDKFADNQSKKKPSTQNNGSGPFKDSISALQSQCNQSPTSMAGGGDLNARADAACPNCSISSENRGASNALHNSTQRCTTTLKSTSACNHLRLPGKSPSDVGILKGLKPGSDAHLHRTVDNMNFGSMHELQSALKSAIAHCKQSHQMAN
ncbi:hypothetical protein KP509_07G062400 [Ceratopteris richardii]|nr:hypothetical protein KP509_07G062400 [Ceratopteris richardii]